MGLKKAVNQGVLAAFKTLGDLNSVLTYKAFTGTVTRDLDAGTSVPNSTDYTLKYSVFVKFTEKENDKDVTTLTSSKLLFPATLLPVAPKASDLIVGHGGRTWEVQKVLSEPSDSVTVLQVRTSK